MIIGTWYLEYMAETLKSTKKTIIHMNLLLFIILAQVGEERHKFHNSRILSLYFLITKTFPMSMISMDHYTMKELLNTMGKREMGSFLMMASTLFLLILTFLIFTNLMTVPKTINICRLSKHHRR